MVGVVASVSFIPYSVSFRLQSQAGSRRGDWAVCSNYRPLKRPYMRSRKYTILLASALLIACGDDDNPVEGSRDNTIEENRRPGQLAAAQEQNGGDYSIGNAASHWRQIEIRPENRCSPYDRSDYRYPQSVEDDIIEELGGIYSPYTERCFASQGETDIEHVVALSEAHDSGLCAASDSIRRAFAADPLNLTLASPELNRDHKQHYDGAEWMPPLNQCWFAQRIVAVRRKYGLTIDRREAEALERVLAACSSVEMEFIDCASEVSEIRLTSSDLLSEFYDSWNPGDPPPEVALTSSDPLSAYDDDGNGRITCAEAHQHGIAPVSSNHSAYSFMYDADGVGVVCE